MNTKKLGLFAGVATCVGTVIGSSNLFNVGQGISVCGRWFVIPLVLMVLIYMIQALVISELHEVMPNIKGGYGQYIYVGMGPVISITCQLAGNIGATIFATTVEVSICGSILSELFPVLSMAGWSLAMLAILAVVNCLGVDVFAKVQTVTVAFMFITLLIMGIVGTFNFGMNPVAETEKIVPYLTGVDSIYMAAISVWLFTGMENVIPIAISLKNPKRDVPLSMIIGLVCLLVFNVLSSLGMFNYVDASSLEISSIPHLIYAQNLFGVFGRIWMSIAIMFAGVTSINTALMGTSEVLAGMADSNLFFKAFRKENRFHSCYLGVIVLAVIIGFFIAIGLADSLDIVVSAGSIFMLLGYVTEIISLICIKNAIQTRDGIRLKVIALCILYH